jgi:uncharacterized protein
MLQIDVPRSRSDFENIRWYVSHHGSSIYVEKKKWFLHVDSPCRHLRDDGKCGIYETRPQICREHDPGECEYDQDYHADLEFMNLEDLDQYIQKRFSKVAKKACLKKPQS